MDDKLIENPKVFLSYCQKYTDIKDMFAELLRSMDLNVEVFDYGAVKNPTEKAKELINSCDGIIGLLTPDDQTKDGKEVYSRSVHTEISMAYAGNKKTQLIAINNTETSGLPYQTNTVFKLNIEENKQIDHKCIPQLFKTLRDFEKDLREIIDSKITFTDSPLKYKSIEFTQKILSNEELLIQMQCKAITLKNIKMHQHYGSSNFYRKNNHNMQLENGIEDITFRLFEPKGTGHKLQLLRNDHSQIAFSFSLEPTLETGTTLSYGYQRRHKNYIFYTFKELYEAIKEERISNLTMAENKMVGECWEVNAPTDRLKMSFEFPPGYPINRVALIVMMRNGHISKDETDKIKELVEKEEDPFLKSYKLSIDIPEPKPSFSYYLLYEPPHLTEIY